jgi:hypothetical protein
MAQLQSQTSFKESELIESQSEKQEFHEDELDQLEEDILNPRNFHNNLYQDDNFMAMK